MEINNGARLLNKLDVFAILCIGLGIRAVVSLHSYSGANKPPMFGDYEAQRHWQEITINTPIEKWYTNTTENDLLYWGLDYPPLTAYHSYINGKVAQSINNSYVELYTSRGIETDEHKRFMRLTVLLCDVLMYLPACYILAITLKKHFKQSTSVLSVLLLIMLYPGQILIDNGHFQYNNISLAFAALAIAAILRDFHCAAAFLFTLALNYKQMELYHSLPFFCFLLRQSFVQKSSTEKIMQFIKIATTVVVTQTILILPWMTSFENLCSIVSRMFPFNRGVFEDKVANIWCALNIVYKFKQKVSIGTMGLICLFTTAAFAFPINIHMFLKHKKDTFLLCLTNTALVFFIFSYQVHEKSILLAVLPSFCLFAISSFELIWFLEVTVFSMLPLLVKDGLVIAYISLMVIFHVCMRSINTSVPQKPQLYNYCYWCSQILMIILTIPMLIGMNPVRYPDIWPLLISVFSCGHFVAFLLFGIYRQVTVK